MLRQYYKTSLRLTSQFLATTNSLAKKSLLVFIRISLPLLFITVDVFSGLNAQMLFLLIFAKTLGLLLIRLVFTKFELLLNKIFRIYDHITFISIDNCSANYINKL